VKPIYLGANAIILVKNPHIYTCCQAQIRYENECNMPQMPEENEKDELGITAPVIKLFP